MVITHPNQCLRSRCSTTVAPATMARGHAYLQSRTCTASSPVTAVRVGFARPPRRVRRRNLRPSCSLGLCRLARAKHRACGARAPQSSARARDSAASGRCPIPNRAAGIRYDAGGAQSRVGTKTCTRPRAGSSEAESFLGRCSRVRGPQAVRGSGRPAHAAEAQLRAQATGTGRKRAAGRLGRGRRCWPCAAVAARDALEFEEAPAR
jgi:hypothetical protein